MSTDVKLLCSTALTIHMFITSTDKVGQIITSADEVGEVMFSVAFVCLCVCVCVCLFVCLFVCWFVCPDDNSKSIIAISMKLSEIIVTVPE